MNFLGKGVVSWAGVGGGLDVIVSGRVFYFSE